VAGRARQSTRSRSSRDRCGLWPHRRSPTTASLRTASASLATAPSVTSPDVGTGRINAPTGDPLRTRARETQRHRRDKSIDLHVETASRPTTPDRRIGIGSSLAQGAPRRGSYAARPTRQICRSRAPRYPEGRARGYGGARDRCGHRWWSADGPPSSDHVGSRRRVALGHVAQGRVPTKRAIGGTSACAGLCTTLVPG
jgi:hypothetical protein